MLSFNDYQKKAHETADYPSGEIGGAVKVDYLYPVMGLSEEAGEVAGKFAKAVRDSNGFISPERKTEIEKELGDVLWFLAEVCTVLGTDFESIAEKNLAKLASRKQRGVIHGEGDNR